MKKKTFGIIILLIAAYISFVYILNMSQIYSYWYCLFIVLCVYIFINLIHVLDALISVLIYSKQIDNVSILKIEKQPYSFIKLIQSRVFYYIQTGEKNRIVSKKKYPFTKIETDKIRIYESIVFNKIFVFDEISLLIDLILVISTALFIKWLYIILL